MAKDNRLLGEFNLEGIPPAPRGVPQIKVKFDLDANGILNVSAKDVGTGKEQKVRIEQSSGLSEAEIKAKLAEAEAHAAEDKKKRQLAELHNQAETMCYQLEKLIKEQGDKLSAADKAPLEAAIAKTRDVAKSDDVDKIKSAIGELEQVSHAFSKTLYEAGTKGSGAAQPEASTNGAKAGDEDVVDAEFEVKE